MVLCKVRGCVSVWGERVPFIGLTTFTSVFTQRLTLMWRCLWFEMDSNNILGLLIIMFFTIFFIWSNNCSSYLRRPDATVLSCCQGLSLSLLNAELATMEHRQKNSNLDLIEVSLKYTSFSGNWVRSLLHKRTWVTREEWLVLLPNRKVQDSRIQFVTWSIKHVTVTSVKHNPELL